MSDAFREAAKAIREAEAILAAPRQRRMKLRDISPKITFEMADGSAVDPDLEDALTRRLINEAGDPSLPKVPPRATTKRTAPPADKPGPSPISLRPKDYAALEPSSPEEWEFLTRLWWGNENGHMMDTPRKLQNRIKATQMGFSPWGKPDYHPYAAVPEKWKKYEEYKRKRMKKKR